MFSTAMALSELGGVASAMYCSRNETGRFAARSARISAFTAGGTGLSAYGAGAPEMLHAERRTPCFVENPSKTLLDGANATTPLIDGLRAAISSASSAPFESPSRRIGRL